MLAEWITHGVRVGVEICTATFTVVVIVGAILALIGLGAKILKEADNEKNDRPY